MSEGVNNLDWREFNSIPSPRMSRSKLKPPKATDQNTMTNSLQLRLLLSAEFDLLKRKIVMLENRIEYLNEVIKRKESMSSSTIPMIFLDECCENSFCLTPTPSKSQLNSLLASIDAAFPDNDRKTTQSEIRKWFRKRREKTTIKLCNLLERNHPNFKEEEERNILLATITTDDAYVSELLRTVGVLFEDEEAGIQYFRDRLKNHLINKEPK